MVNEIENLSPDELKFRYRPNGWNIQQIVHHCADSHINSFIRFKLALTENKPTIRPYFENRWAEQADYSNSSISLSLKIIEGLHKRWAILLKSSDITMSLTELFIIRKPNKKLA